MNSESHNPHPASTPSDRSGRSGSPPRSDLPQPNTHHPTPAPRAPHPFLALVLLFVVPMAVGALLAPQVCRLLEWLGQYMDLGPRLTDPKFKRVLSRCVLVVAMILLYPAIRLSGFKSLPELGWAKTPERWRIIWKWFAIGTVMMTLLYVFSDLGGALYLRPRSTEFTRMLGKFTAILVGAFFIGIFEETFFRGFVFGIFRRATSFWLAAIISSFIFAIIHFARPAAPETLDPTYWAAGFQMLPHLTDGVQPQYFWPTIVNLFLMGLLLCLLYDLFGNLYAAIGLHGGWVWALGIGTFMFDRNGKRLWPLYGNSETISMTWLGAIVLVAFIATVLLVRRRWNNKRS